VQATHFVDEPSGVRVGRFAGGDAFLELGEVVCPQRVRVAGCRRGRGGEHFDGGLRLLRGEAVVDQLLDEVHGASVALPSLVTRTGTRLRSFSRAWRGSTARLAR
jgi:hypothetical protein